MFLLFENNMWLTLSNLIQFDDLLYWQNLNNIPLKIYVFIAFTCNTKSCECFCFFPSFSHHFIFFFVLIFVQTGKRFLPIFKNFLLRMSVTSTRQLSLESLERSYISHYLTCRLSQLVWLMTSHVFNLINGNQHSQH